MEGTPGGGLVAKLCLIHWDSMDCSPLGSSAWNSPGKNTDSHVLLQGIFPTQGLKPGLHKASGFLTV